MWNASIKKKLSIPVRVGEGGGQSFTKHTSKQAQNRGRFRK